MTSTWESDDAAGSPEARFGQVAAFAALGLGVGAGVGATSLASDSASRELLNLGLCLALAAASLTAVVRPGVRAWVRAIGGTRTRAVALGLCVAAGFNWFRGHDREPVHPTDFFHYYAGAKYFRELGYTSLYRCTSAALVAHGFKLDGWKVRNLKTRELEPILPDADLPACQALLGARWNTFRHDAVLYAETARPNYTRVLLQDHGFNGTPTWTLVPRLLIGDGEASVQQWVWLSRIDGLFILGALIFCVWGFGLNAGLVAAVVLGLNSVCRFEWAGGSLFRYDWYFLTSASLFLFRRERWWAGATLAGLATCVRLFPLFIFLPVGVAAFRSWRTGPGRRVLAEVALGVGLAAFLALGAGFIADGAEVATSWQASLANITAHATEGLINRFSVTDVAVFIFNDAVVIHGIAWVVMIAVLTFFWVVAAPKFPMSWSGLAALGLASSAVFVSLSGYYAVAAGLTSPAVPRAYREFPLVFAIAVSLLSQFIQLGARANIWSGELLFVAFSVLATLMMLSTFGWGAWAARSQHRARP